MKTQYKIKSGKRALFYFPQVGRRRYYRQEESSHDKKLKLLTYKTKGYAQEVCDEINRAYNDTFKVVRV